MLIETLLDGSLQVLPWPTAQYNGLRVSEQEYVKRIDIPSR